MKRREEDRSMRTIVTIGATLLLATTVLAWESDPPPRVTVKAPPAEIKVKVQASDGATEQEIAEGIAAENAKRDPAAQAAARVAERKAESDEAHQKRVSKICDSISEKAMRNDPSLRRMCGE
jgi:hypothetical protein